MPCCVSCTLRDSEGDTQGGSGELKAPTLRLIKLLLVVHIYDAEQDTFKPLQGMPAHLPLQIHNATRALQSIAEGRVLCVVAVFAVASCAPCVTAKQLRAAQLELVQQGVHHQQTSLPSRPAQLDRVMMKPKSLQQ